MLTLIAFRQIPKHVFLIAKRVIRKEIDIQNSQVKTFIGIIKIYNSKVPYENVNYMTFDVRVPTKV